MTSEKNTSAYKFKHNLLKVSAVKTLKTLFKNGSLYIVQTWNSVRYSVFASIRLRR